MYLPRPPRALVLLTLLAPVLVGCGDDNAPRDGGVDATADASGLSPEAWCLERDAGTERLPNLWLAEVVAFEPGLGGSQRTSATDPGLFDDDHHPLQNDRAFGPPGGTGCGRGAYDVMAVGVNGSATFAFAPGYHIVDGPGDDFITFEGRWAWSCEADQMVNELAHVEVSEDGSHWYYNADEAYDVNPTPGQDAEGYVHANVRGVHGKSPTWANPEAIRPAQEIVEGQWVDVPGVWVCRDIAPRDPYLGGDRFDLATFRSTVDDAPWPADGRMRYLRITDDDSILDGQDYAKAWSTGAHMQAALGINIAED